MDSALKEVPKRTRNELGEGAMGSDGAEALLRPLESVYPGLEADALTAHAREKLLPLPPELNVKPAPNTPTFSVSRRVGRSIISVIQQKLFRK